MAYVRLDKVGADQHIESIVASEDLKNGGFLELGALQADGEARLATPSGDTTKELVFHASVPLTYEDRTNELDFTLKAGKVGRAYVVRTGNIASVSFDGVIGTPAKGAIVAPHADGFEVVETAPEGLHGEIIAIDNDLYAGQLAVIRLTK
ncbi:hypothetical protein P4639_22665 [Priestia megaterium]|uniref:hypothetical protein n=1 Tax=Priestia megaterium TaxID=1404 RepID=UPI002E2026B6|nr:hypothetical protein [Priestia megaterium]